MQYYRTSTSNNNKEDTKLLNNHMSTIYNKLNNYIDERDNLLSLFNNRINQDIPVENIFHDDIKVDADNRYKLILYVNQNLVIFIDIFFIYL